MTKYCIKCNDELTDENWCPSWKNSNRCTCKKCKHRYQQTDKYKQTHKISCIKYAQENKEKIHSKQQQYYYSEHDKKRGEEYYKNNKQKIINRTKKWGKSHRKETNSRRRIKYMQSVSTEEGRQKRRDFCRKRYAKYKEGFRRRAHNYNKTLKGKQTFARGNARRRTLGFCPLNEKFTGSEPHHINENDVIYVPKEWNHVVYHNLRKGHNMEIVNAMAFFFLLMQNIKDLSLLFVQ